MRKNISNFDHVNVILILIFNNKLERINNEKLQK